MARRSSRLSACIKTANIMVRHCRRVDAGAVNPLLAELGAGALTPFEFTPLFAALHGAACARGREQLIVALHFATTLLDAGASVVGEDNSGRHAPLEGVGGAKNAGRNLKGDSTTSSCRRSGRTRSCGPPPPCFDPITRTRRWTTRARW